MDDRFLGFRKLNLRDWQQFGEVEIEFHPRATILTGANGSGKSTILRLLGRHFGWEWMNLSTPTNVRESGQLTFAPPVGRGLNDGVATEIGAIEYTSGDVGRITVPSRHYSPGYQPTIQGQDRFAGLYLPSHRSEFSYAAVQSIPLRPRFGHDAFTLVQQSIQSAYSGSGGHTSTYHMKEILISLAIFGFGNAAVEANPEARRLYDGYQDILRGILPPELGFQSLGVRGSSEVVFVTKSGEFLLDAVSGGIGALIVLAWQIYMYASTRNSGYTVVIDEPENHLHPGMQRTLLPNLLRAFPAASFVVATHSPLVIGSVRNSHVYALAFGTEGKVTSIRLDLEDKAASATDILQEVLGVPVTLPVWVEAEIARISARYSHLPMTDQTLSQLRADLTEFGLDRWIPEVVVQWHKEQTTV